MAVSKGNRVCALFGIRYPLLMGAITPKPELGALVSNAGGLGCIEGISSPDKLRAQIRAMREQSDAPFSVNFPLAYGNRDQKMYELLIVPQELTVVAGYLVKHLTNLFKQFGVPADAFARRKTFA